MNPRNGDLNGTDPDCSRELQRSIEAKQAAFLGGRIHASGAPAIVIPQGQFTIAVGGKREVLDDCVDFLKEVAQRSFVFRSRGCRKRSRLL